MVSFRRLAREWALKVLYQADVGKGVLQETLAAAQERLRREFVLRGSRTASGSPVEEICMDVCSRLLAADVPALRLPLIHALADGAARVLAEAPYWQELRVERSLRRRMPGVGLHPPRLLIPLSDAQLEPGSADPAAGDFSELRPEERVLVRNFQAAARMDLPAALEIELRARARSGAAEISAPPEPAPPSSIYTARRDAFVQGEVERWRRASLLVERHLVEWMRTAAFVQKLVIGEEQYRKEIDQEIELLSLGWRLERQVAVDRNILRLAAYELLYMDEAPTAAVINEAVELAKKYSTAESGRFVNGVLGTLASVTEGRHPRANDDAEPEEEDAIDLQADHLLEETERAL